MSITTDARAALARLHAGEVTHYLHTEIARLLADAVAEIDRLQDIMIGSRPPTPVASPPIPTFTPPESPDDNPDHHAP